MATAEHLLHEAQYAFHSISYGETPRNRRHAARASSLCRKIIRKYPASIEAAEAHAILRRLGEEAYSSKLALQHVHISQAEHHRPQPRSRRPRQDRLAAGTQQTLNWAGLVAAILAMPKLLLAALAFAGIVLFGFLGPFLFLPLLALFLFSGPFRGLLKPEQDKNLNEFIVRANDFLERRQS